MDEHYLRRELLALSQRDATLLTFLVDQGLDGVSFWDLEQPEHEWVSPRLWCTLGYDPQQKRHLRSEWREVVQPDDLKASLRNIERHCAEPDYPYDQLLRCRHANGAVVWLRCRGYAVRDEHGKATRMLGLLSQVSAAMGDEEERFRLVVEAAPSAMLMVDRHRRITLVNQKTEQLFGYDREELLGQELELLVPDRYRAAHPQHVAHFAEQPRARAMGAGRELYGRRKDGSEVPVEIGLTPIQTPEGLWTLASIIDITQRRLAEAAHERLAAIVEFSEDAIISTAPSGHITSWNEGAVRLFGYTAEEALGASAMMLIPEVDRAHEQEIEQRLQQGLRIDHIEAKRRRKNGSEIDVLETRSPIRNARGEVVGESRIARDITELKRRDLELKRSNAELEQFAYVASHDLQEPLRMVANYTELLAQRYEGKLDEKADKYIRYASEGAKRMQRLVQDLLAYSRVGSQGKPFVPVSSALVLRSVLDSLKRLIRETGATIELGTLPFVQADEVQLGQLFQNMISNAIKFRSESAPHIKLDAVRKGEYWLFSVADNGIGIDMQYADRIFQMFQRLHERGKYEGSGIGLSIAKRIVERHGGRLWVESKPDVGTTFWFTLQAAEGGTP